jgi:hypothetical protein
VLGEYVDAAHDAVLGSQFSVAVGTGSVSQMVGRKAKIRVARRVEHQRVEKELWPSIKRVTRPPKR